MYLLDAAMRLRAEGKLMSLNEFNQRRESPFSGHGLITVDATDEISMTTRGRNKKLLFAGRKCVEKSNRIFRQPVEWDFSVS